jgi:DNA-binding beta-propeller fold protein YncE
MKINQILAGIIGVFCFVACNKTEEAPAPQPYDNGVIVLNAGNFFDNNGTISLLQRVGNTTSLDIFQKENTKSLGGGLSGYAEINEKGLILVDNSTAGKDVIEIVDAHTFKSIATIGSKDIENPRNVIKVSNTKAYVTCWDALGAYPDTFKNPGYVAVVDLVTNTVIKKITVQSGAETIVVVGNEAFVGNTGSYKKTLTVIDIATDAIKQSLEVGVNPTLIGLDAQNKLWIYSESELIKFNASTKVIESRIKINSANKEKSPSAFVMSKDKNSIFFTNSFYDAADGYTEKGETYNVSLNSTSFVADKPIIKKLFGGGLAIDPQTGNLYAGLIPSYSQAGYVFRFTPAGVLIDSVKAGVAPSKFFFKN